MDGTIDLSLWILADFLSRRSFSIWRILLVRSLSHFVKDGWLLLTNSSVVSRAIRAFRSLQRDSLFLMSLNNKPLLHSNR